MNKCENCQHWIIKRGIVYSDGSEIVRWTSQDGEGHCDSIDIVTKADFGCNRFLENQFGDTGQVEVIRKIGAPWQHFVMIPCPDCEGKGDGTRGHRCAGTGLVRLYDDGYIGDEQTRMHPKEKEHAPPPVCRGCGGGVTIGWKHCPACGISLLAPAETEVIPFDVGVA